MPGMDSSSAVVRFRDAISSAIANGDRRAFDRATLAFARDTHSPVTDVLSTPAIQRDAHITQLLSIAADLQWIPAPKTWASLLKRTQSSSPPIPLTRFSSQSQSQHHRPQQQSLEQDHLLSTQPQPAYQHWEQPFNLDTPTARGRMRPHSVSSLPQGRPFAPLLAAQTVHLPTAIRMTPSGPRGSFRAWKWHGALISGLSAGAAPNPTPTSSAAGAHPMEIPALDLDLDTLQQAGISTRSSPWWQHAVDNASTLNAAGAGSATVLNSVEDSLTSVQEIDPMRPAIAATTAALEALGPFLGRRQRTLLRQAISRVSPLDGLEVVMRAAREACRVSSDVSSREWGVSSYSGRGSTSNLPTGDEAAMGNISATGNLDRSASVAWGNSNGWTGAMWQNDGRDVPWRALGDGTVDAGDVISSIATGVRSRSGVESGSWNALDLTSTVAAALEPVGNSSPSVRGRSVPDSNVSH